jgi:hypothetical protein
LDGGEGGIVRDGRLYAQADVYLLIPRQDLNHMEFGKVSIYSVERHDPEDDVYDASMPSVSIYRCDFD